MKRIRIIEDDDAIRTELTTLLLTNGYLPVEEEPCDLILMDVNLPGENGFILCRKLRQSSNVPVIFLTARDTPEDELLAFGVGGDDFIRKPYNSAVLLARIAREDSGKNWARSAGQTLSGLYGAWGTAYELLGLYAVKGHFPLYGRNRHLLSDIDHLALRTSIYIAVHLTCQWPFYSSSLHGVFMETG